MDDAQFKVSEEDKALNRAFPPQSPQILWGLEDAVPPQSPQIQRIWGDAEGRGA